MNGKGLTAIGVLVVLVVFAPSAEGSPYLMKFEGTIQGIVFSAEFVYDDPFIPFLSGIGADGMPVGFTPIIHASISFDNQLIYSQAYPGGQWSPALQVPAGVTSYFWLDAEFYGPFLPPGLTHLGFYEQNVTWDFGGGGVYLCRPGSDSFVIAGTSCSYSLTQLTQAVPEPSSILYGLGAVAALAIRPLRMRAKKSRVHAE